MIPSQVNIHAIAFVSRRKGGKADRLIVIRGQDKKGTRGARKNRPNDGARFVQ